ncbi:MAG: hypothetical protein V4437_00415 [Patescibacteria group bacterium]
MTKEGLQKAGTRSWGKALLSFFFRFNPYPGLHGQPNDSIPH